MTLAEISERATVIAERFIKDWIALDRAAANLTLSELLAEMRKRELDEFYGRTDDGTGGTDGGAGAG